MKLVLIPAGEFMMGSRESAEDLAKAFAAYGAKPEVFKHEYPYHRVGITKPFYLEACEVTVGQFRKFVEDSGYKTDAEKRTNGVGAIGFDPSTGKYTQNAEYSWRKPGFPQEDDHPVVNVSWNDAVAFCEWLSRKEKKTYSLPTEAEWEYACRAGTTTQYSNGDDPETLMHVGNVADSSSKAKFPNWPDTIRGKDGYVFTAPAAQFKPNAFGFYDMHGNVWEWCADWYSEDYYARSPRDDPEGPASGSGRVFRGGAWNFGVIHYRSAYRDFAPPDASVDTVGFRVAQALEQSAIVPQKGADLAK